MTFDFGSYSYHDQDSTSSTSSTPPSSSHNHPTHLTWRLPKDESYSDWTIIIRSSSQQPSTTTTTTTTIKATTSYHYNVHKVALGIGPRYSEYFSRLFKSHTNTVESKNEQSVIHLEPSAADAFPLMLDYLYGDDIRLATEHAVALRHLSNYFGIGTLFDDVGNFMQMDLTFETMTSYYWDEAIRYGDALLIDAMIPIVVGNFRRVDKDFLMTMTPERFRDVVASLKLTMMDGDCCELLSVRVAEYFRCGCWNNDVTAADFFRELTDGEIMPCVSPATALYFLKLNEEFNGGGVSGGDGDDDVEVSLLYRTAKAFTEHEDTYWLLENKHRQHDRNDDHDDDDDDDDDEIVQRISYKKEYNNLSVDARLRLVESALYIEKKQNQTLNHFLHLLGQHHLQQCVIVWGAGINSINGIYTPNNSGNTTTQSEKGFRLYSKSGVYDDKEGMYSLYRNDDEGSWVISFWFDDTGDELDFYGCSSMGEDPPSDGWAVWVDLEGEDPPPKVMDSLTLVTLVNHFKLFILNS